MATVTATVVNCSAYQINDGSIKTSSTGGTPPYTYSWSNGQTTPNISNVGAGKYVLTVTDSVGALGTSTSVVTQPTIFDVDKPLPDTGLLRDADFRDVYSRQMKTGGVNIMGHGSAQLIYSLYNTPSTIIPAVVQRVTQESDGSYGQYTTTYDASGVPHDILHVTDAGITVNGSFNLTGPSTTTQTNSIIVNDKFIQLSDQTTSTAGLDGSGIILGNSSLNRSLLYSYASDSLVSTMPLTAPSFMSGSNLLSSTAFTASTAAGSIVLDGTGLTISGARFVNSVAATQQIMTNAGVYDRNSGNVFGYNSSTNGWTSSGAPVIAPTFQISSSNTTLSKTNLAFDTVSAGVQNTFGAGGLFIGNTMTCTTGGVALQDSAAVVSLGNGSIRLIYDNSSSTLNIQKLSGGSYNTIAAFS
jgi:hypothetical protein